MPKLTDESVAKALGWTRHPNIGTGGDLWARDGKRVWDDYSPPLFTTSLDAIVAEIEARGFVWTIYMMNGSRDYRAEVDTILGHPNNQYFAKTAPVALCTALLAAIQAERKGDR